jgi:hypothetical protein
LDKRLDGLQSRSERGDEEEEKKKKKFVPLSGIEFRSSSIDIILDCGETVA